MKPSVFISRSYSQAGSFIEMVEPYVSRITAQSLISFGEIKAPELPDAGWLLFYSRSGVDFFIGQHNPAKVHEQGLKTASFGPKTAAYLSEKGFDIDFTGTGEAKSTAERLISIIGNDQITFVRGSKSLHSLDAYIPDDSRKNDMIVYSQTPKANIPIAFHDILVFTSPMNLKAYLNSNILKANQNVITIGATTATAGLRNGIETIHIAKEASMEGLGQAVLAVIDQNRSSSC